MVVLNRIYTKTGDGGQTRLASGAPVSKSDARVEAYGAVGGLNAGIGVLPCGVAAQLPNIVQLGDPIPSLSMPLWILAHEDLKDTPRVRALLDFLGDVFSREKPLLEGTRAFVHEP